MASNQNLGPQTIRVPFLDATDIRPGQEALITKDQVFLNGFFEAVKNPLGKAEYYFIKRPGTVLFQNISPSGTGRGCYAWKTTQKFYSVADSKIFSNSTDLGVTLTTNSGFVNFEETRPGATTQYLGLTDGVSLYLIGSDDSVIVLNNVNITGVSVANPTHITALAHGLNTGNKIIIRNCTTVTPSTINDIIYTITKIDADHFSIPLNVTASGAGPFGTIGVFPSPNTADLKYMDGYFFTMKNDGTIWNCSVDDPTTWPVTSFISSIMVPGRSVGLGRANNLLVAFSDRHYQMFYDAANPFGSPLANVEQAEQKVGCVSTNTIAFQENILFWVSNSLTGGFSVYRLDGTSNLQDIGTATLNRSLTSNFFLTPGQTLPTTKQVILTSGTSWTVPSDFNKFNNTIEAIGAGSGGLGGDGFTIGGKGGGGGAYARISNFDPLGAGSIPYAIGLGGTSGLAGGDTLFNTTSLIAKGGSASGTGGLASASTGTTKYSGGSGGIGNSAPSGGGGGGAAGKFADGMDGLPGNSNQTGGKGGTGDSNAGGLGGNGGTSSAPPENGGVGTEWGTVGSGGGGGGGGGSFDTGGNGGLYGGAGGGSSVGTGSAGSGRNGLIVITYTPQGPPDAAAANGYILRISGHIFYILNLVNNKETWIYQAQQGIWVLWRNHSGPFPIVNATSFSPPGQPSLIVGQDIETGTLWKIDSTAGQDNGINFEYRIQTNPLTFGTMQRKFYDRVDLIGDKTDSSTPILISYSDDNYITFSAPRSLDIGNPRAFSRAWNNSRKRAWRISYTGPSIFRLHALEFDLELGKE